MNFRFFETLVDPFPALDRLVVIEAGEIVESGSHAQLLEQGGIYKRLWDYQSGGFLAPD